MTTIERNLSRRTYDECGAAIVVAMVVMALMLALGMAALAVTDTQTDQTRVERVRESTFNLAEGALQQQSFQLSGRGWPRQSTDALPLEECNESSDPALTTNRRCPTPSALVTAAGTGAYDESDYKVPPSGQATTWTTYVRDNSALNNKTYNEAVIAARPRWDANGDGYIWVKATATVRTRTRTIVALLKRDPIPILLRKAVLVAGALEIGEGGQNPVISTDATTPPVVRCGGFGVNCADYRRSARKKDSQVVPDKVSYDPSFGSLVPADTVSKLVDSATVFTSCPANAAAAQGFVVIDVPETTTCKFTGTTNFNSPTAPGFIIMRRGTLDFAGNGQFYGLILHLNEGGRGAPVDRADNCVQINGTFDVFGGVVVEGKCGYFMTGNARLTFAPNNLNFSVTGVAGLVQNTWRELPRP